MRAAKNRDLGCMKRERRSSAPLAVKIGDVMIRGDKLDGGYLPEVLVLLLGSRLGVRWRSQLWCQRKKMTGKRAKSIEGSYVVPRREGCGREGSLGGSPIVLWENRRDCEVLNGHAGLPARPGAWGTWSPKITADGGGEQ